jgi:2-methylcitrate dehydratase PrpD
VKQHKTKRTIIKDVSSYIASTGDARLPAEVVQKAKHHILDTLAAIVSGSKLKPGRLAKGYIRGQGGVKEAQVAGSRLVCSAIHAAFANAMMAHADETDDSNARARMHPGSSIVPAALAMAERERVDGMRFLKGVVAGYDIGCRLTQALGAGNLRQAARSAHSIGGHFGAAAAATSVAGLDEHQVKYVLSYAAQQASGVTFLYRDEEHVQKAFVFAGMPARNGVTAAILVQSGFTGVPDPFTGEENFFDAFSPIPNPRPELLAQGLGSEYEIMFTNIKKFSVGSPIQAPLDALLILIGKYGLTSENVERIIARLPDYGVPTVNDASMPNINLQYILAVTLLDGDLTFKAAHSYERMNDPAVLKVKKRIKLVDDPELSTAKIMRQGIVEVTTKDGTRLREHVVSVRGAAENPMTTAEVEKKSRELMAPVLGRDRTEKLIHAIWNLERVRNVRQLRRLIAS